MTVTRANLEKILIKRVGGMLTGAGLDGTTIDGTNVDLADPISVALRKSSLSVADFTEPDDDDVAAVTDDLIDQVIDLAHLRALKNIEGNLALVDITLGPRSESLSQLAKQVRTMIDALQSRIDAEYDLDLSDILTGGTIALDFAEKDDTDGVD